jgi:hypothetical protein
VRKPIVAKFRKAQLRQRLMAEDFVTMRAYAINKMFVPHTLASFLEKKSLVGAALV